MARKFIDLSVALEMGIVSDPPMALPEIEYINHAKAADQIGSFFPGLDKKDLPGEEGWAVENLKISTHNGTHLDAPYPVSYTHLRPHETERNRGCRGLD